MNFCMQCGTKLVRKYLDSEGAEIPWCPSCKDYRFPVFNTGVSMIITNQTKDKVLLIRQYGGDEYILCAGFVNKGEDAEDAAKREIMEELGLDTLKLSFNRSHYYKPSNTLIFNFTATVDEVSVRPNEEIDSWSWLSIEEARNKIRKNSLARAFLLGWLDGEYVFPAEVAPPYKIY